ncbi:MAG: hypothetical protein KBE09_02770 [Candidatus Pacebacteria bacterium]|nr:hypothetical protein [Candidatus Paceibacterota bacterium]
MFEKRVSVLSKVDWTEAESVFYELMSGGWASGTKPLIARYPGHVHMQHSKGPFKLIDMWTKTPGSRHSSGYTVLYYDCMYADDAHIENDYQPIWTMQYGGFYSRPAAAFVQRVLFDTYAKPSVHGFCGCRGPSMVHEGGFAYANKWVTHSSFHAFSGVEIVRNTHQNEIVGQHEYMGRAHVTPAWAER